jgi:hypothetical protein
VNVPITPYDHQPARTSIPVRQAKNRPRARPDWEGNGFGEGDEGGSMCCVFYLKTLPVNQVGLYQTPCIVSLILKIHNQAVLESNGQTGYANGRLSLFSLVSGLLKRPVMGSLDSGEAVLLIKECGRRLRRSHSCS